MNRKNFAFAPLVAASGLAVLLCSSAIASPQPQDNRGDYHYRGDRISTQGEITTMSREGDQYRIELNHGSYTYYVPMATIHNRDIRVGDRVRLGGAVSGDSVTADFVAFSGEPAYTTDPAYRAVPFGSTGWLSGTVINSNRRLNYITIRDDASGLPVKIDVRNMDTKRSVNVWRTRNGDHISVNGSWSNRDTFGVSIVQY